MKNIVLALVLACASSTVLAATPVTMTGAQGLQKIGEVSSQASTLDSFEQNIAKEADRKGASAYRITSATGNNNIFGTAILYK